MPASSEHQGILFDNNISFASALSDSMGLRRGSTQGEKSVQRQTDVVLPRHTFLSCFIPYVAFKCPKTSTSINHSIRLFTDAPFDTLPALHSPLCRNYRDNGVLCWSGNDDEAHSGRHEYGGQGVISVISNLLPGVFSRLMAERDDATAAALQELTAWLFCEPNPIAL
jgi:hypothetical protein